MIHSKIIALILCTTLVLDPAFARSEVITSALQLPAPGIMIRPSEAFTPSLLRGMVVYPDKPLQFDFILDSGDAKPTEATLSTDSQRMVNYFLAALAVPQKDLWVNLSPVEKDRIVPEQLIKTELGRDLLAQDYLLKQLTASLIYPEDELGKSFWKKVYDEAFRKFGVTDVPVDVFNKVWIIPEKASVYEKGNSVFVTDVHLKVMLEADYMAQGLSDGKTQSTESTPVSELSKQILREVIVPAIEKEVNTGRNFGQLRQVVYSLVLAQWYQDVLKESVLNKTYSGKNKVAGIDLNDPRSKELIYNEYMSAYKKGVFNYIKEETDRLTNEPMPKKYFSGGVQVGQIFRKSAYLGATSSITSENLHRVEGVFRVNDSAQANVSSQEWNTPLYRYVVYNELKECWDESGTMNAKKMEELLMRYVQQFDSERKKHPVQGAWPVLQPITMLTKEQEADIVAWILKKYPDSRPILLDNILLMNNVISQTWMRNNVPYIVKKMIWLIAAEIHLFAGGLGYVMKIIGKGMKELGANVAFVESGYRFMLTREGHSEEINYNSTGININITSKFDYQTPVGNAQGNIWSVKTTASYGIDPNDVPTYLIRDIEYGGQYIPSTEWMYAYNGRNRATREEFMAFMNPAVAELVNVKWSQMMTSGIDGNIFHPQDGQFGIFEAQLKSRYGDKLWMKNSLVAYTSHTYPSEARGNRGELWDVARVANDVLKNMFRINGEWINLFRRSDRIDYTSGGLNGADLPIAVSDAHARDIGPLDPTVALKPLTNGADVMEDAKHFIRNFDTLKSSGKIPDEVEYQRISPAALRYVKELSIKDLNALKLKSSIGRIVWVALKALLVAESRRFVVVKAGLERAFTKENILWLVQQGIYVIFMCPVQDTEESKQLAEHMKEIEREIDRVKKENPDIYSGDFFFVENFRREDQLTLRAAAHLVVADSDHNSEAAGATEEGAMANGSYYATSYADEGILAAQGLQTIQTWSDSEQRWILKQPGQGNIVIPKEPTAQSWRETVYAPMLHLWKKGADEFYSGASLGPRLVRALSYLLTAAANLRGYNDVYELRQKKRNEDQKLLQAIKQMNNQDKQTFHNIIKNGCEGVNSFEFHVYNGSLHRIFPNAVGLEGFLRKWEEIENTEEYGRYSLLGQYISGDIQNYFLSLFKGAIIEDALKEWISNLDLNPGERGRDSDRLRHMIKEFVGLADQSVNAESSKDSAQQQQGGIDARNIAVNRQGDLTSGVISDSALEEMLVNATGLRGVIIGITPITNVQLLLK